LAASSFLLFFRAATAVCKQLMFGENFSRTVKLMLASGMEPRLLFDVLSNSNREFSSSQASTKWIASGNEFGIRVSAIGCRVP
jgi:hypothetical protein